MDAGQGLSLRDIVVDVKAERFDAGPTPCPGPARRYIRPKESAAVRRQRSLRADTRVFSRLVRACQAASSHHTQASRLVGCLHLYLRSFGCNQRDAGGQIPPGQAAR